MGDQSRSETAASEPSIRIAGWFDWRLLRIHVSGSAPEELRRLDDVRQGVLRHELHHFMHSVSTTLGLDLHRSYLDDLDALAGWKRGAPSPEQQRRRADAATEGVLRHERFRSRYSLVGYWREVGPAFNTPAVPGRWQAALTMGRLDGIDGRPSRYPIVFARFQDGNLGSVGRIPLDATVVFEHLVRLPDLLAAYQHGGVASLMTSLGEAYWGPMLDYHALAHLVSNEGPGGDPSAAYVAACTIAHIAAMFPTEWHDDFGAFQDVVRGYLVGHMDTRDALVVAHPGTAILAMLKPGQPALQRWLRSWVGRLGPEGEEEPRAWSERVHEAVGELVESLATACGFSLEELAGAADTAVAAMRREDYVEPETRSIRDKILAAAEPLLEHKRDFPQAIADDLANRVKFPSGFFPTIAFDDASTQGSLSVAEETFLQKWPTLSTRFSPIPTRAI